MKKKAAAAVPTSAARLDDLRTRGIVSDRRMVEVLGAPGDVLEVGCGTGRVLQWLVATPGRRVTGVERDAEKLRIAREHPALSAAADLELVEADFLSYAPAAGYDRVLFSFHVICEFSTVAGRIAALRKAVACLKPDGRVVVAAPLHDFAEMGRRNVSHRFRIGTAPDEWEVAIDCRRSSVQQVSHCVVTYTHATTGEVVTSAYENALITRNELLASYAAAGLEVEQEFGMPDLGPLGEECQGLVHVLVREARG